LFIGLINIAVAQSPSCSIASKFYSKDSINVTTFGASTVQGINGLLFQPYLQQNFEYCYVGKVVDITNNGIAGQTTSQGLARFQAAINGRTGFVCILMGINDAFAVINKTSLQVPMSVTQNNMRAMIEMSLKQGLIPIIGTVQFIDDRKSAPAKLVNNYVKLINAGYKKLVTEYHIYLADINAAIGRDYTLYQPDGIHPNANGNKLISYVWFDAINQAIENKLLLVGLNQNFPNPAGSRTTIGFSLSQSGRVNIQLYSMSGVSTRNIVDGFYNSGYHQVDVAISDLSPGIYIYVMQVAGRQLSKKMIIVK
jgi:lysophospholipase L1-like esterase